MPLVQSEEGRLEEDKGEMEEPDEFVTLAMDHPLLQAYELHVNEVEKENKTLRKDLDSVKFQYENLVKESEELGKNLIEKTKRLAELNEKAINGEGPGSVQELRDITETFKREQAVLLNEVEMGRQKMAKLESELKTQTKLAEESTARNRELTTRALELQAGIDTLAHEKEMLESRMNLKLGELKATTSDKEEYYAQKLKQEGELKVLQKSLEQYKSAYEELEARKGSETELMEKELGEKEISIKDLKSKLHVQDRELDDLKETNRKLQRDLEQTKSDFNQMIKIMEDNETKIALFDEREKSLKAMEQECKRKTDDVKLQLEEAKNKDRQRQRQMADMEHQWKEEIDDRQRKHDLLLETAKNQQKALIDKKEEELTVASERLGKLQSAFDKVEADFKVNEEEKKRLTSTLLEMQKEMTGRCTTYEQQLKETAKKSMEEQQRCQLQIEDLARALTRTEESGKLGESQARTLRLQLETAEKKVQILEQENKEVRSGYNSLMLERDSGAKEVERLKKVSQSKLAELEEVHKMKVRTLDEKLSR